MGGSGGAMDCGRGVHEEFGCGVRAAACESRAQLCVGAGASIGTRTEGAGMACGSDAAERDGVRAGKNLRVLRIWLRDWSETVGDENVAGRCAGEGCAVCGGDASGESSNRGGRGDRGGGGLERRPSRQREMQNSGCSMRSDSYGGAVAAVRIGERTHWAALAFTSGFERVRNF